MPSFCWQKLCLDHMALDPGTVSRYAWILLPVNRIQTILNGNKEQSQQGFEKTLKLIAMEK